MCRKILLILMGAVLACSCQEALFYTGYRELPQQSWDSHDTLLYALPVPEHDMATSLIVGMRCTDAVRFEKVTMRVELMREQRVVWADTLTLSLFDDQGRETGHGFPIMDCFSEAVPLRLLKGKHYTLRVKHLMRLDPLDGIPAMGVFVEDAEKE